MDHPPEPSGDACTNRERGEWRGAPTLALWYPQMGGYSGKAVAVGPAGCFAVYVWHDGEFPFEGEAPVKLHHCDARQFINFGQAVLDAFGPIPGGT